jgi:hypothetical protein
MSLNYISDLRDLKVFHENLTNLVEEHKNEIDIEIVELLQKKILDRKDQRLKRLLMEMFFK